MPTLTVMTTIDLSEEAYQYAQALSLAERRRVAGMAVAAAFATAANFQSANEKEGEEEEYPDLPDLPAEHVAAIARGIAAEEAGLVRDGHAVLAETREHLLRGDFSVKHQGQEQ